MPYLIDGNNVMAQTVGWHRDKVGARKGLIRDLARFVAAHRGRVQVVFDGVPDEEFPEGTKYRSVHILYARHGSDADSRIKEMIGKSSYKRDIIMVSSDRELVSFANRHGTRVMTSGRFRKMLEEAKTTSRSKSEADLGEHVNIEEWLEYFSETER
ncbi:MAG: NYN domain-containing protein [Desulfomonilaceae bacterium]|nr:NYN domain-containing protein [Desulfomonilaceae bacterium]